MNEPKAVARSTDPGTSWEAARSVQGITEHQGEVLAAYRGRKDMADEDLVLNLQRSGSKQSPSGIRTRRAELVAQGLLVDTGDRVTGSTGRRMILWGLPRQIVPNPISPLRGSPAKVEQCSCGEGPVGHSTSHETSDRPGIVRMVREGKTDQYVNLRLARSQSQQAKVQASREEEEARKKATPRVDPRSHRLTFGGPTICRRCGGTGGSLWEACYGCSGTGLA